MLQHVLPVISAVLLALVIRQFVFEPMRVKGSSMRSTLHNGEMLLVSKLDYLLGKPRRHDVVICHYPGRYRDRWKVIPQCFVKRIIGLPGETIAIEEGVVLINGQPLEEPYLDPRHTRRKGNMEPRTLGEGEYFVMGDNRDGSNDSRRVGPISRRMIVGKVRSVFFPFRAIRWIR